MNAKEFAEKMNAIKFTLPADARAEYGDEYIDKLVNSYKLKPRKPGSAGNNPLIELLSQFDATAVEIGMVTFAGTATEDSRYYYVGKFEADDLVIDKKNGEVSMKESDQNHILYSCANSEGSFLDAMYTAASFLASVPVGQDVSEHPGVCGAATQCAKLAGGAKYNDFYKMLLGCYE